MIVQLRSTDPRHPDLSPNQPYLVLGIEADDLRILNDQGRPYVYPREIFQVIDPREPEDWKSEIGEDNERYAYPAPLNAAGFFEDFFDEKVEAVVTLWRVMKRRLSRTA